MGESISPHTNTTSIRRRQAGGVKETPEEHALTTIAKEAEARLAAKRAARAEARSIRMHEISLRQNEGDDNVFPDESERSAASAISTTVAKNVFKGEGRYSISRTSSRSEDNSTYDIVDQASSDKLILNLKETIRANEEKYKKAMVSTAQLDNERQALLYQVETLKDDIEELQQSCENTDEELFHKTRDLNKLTREHSNITTELSKALFVVEERERILDEHGINTDGSFKEGYTPITLCSMCGASLGKDQDGNVDETDRHLDRDSLVAIISTLKNEIRRLKLLQQHSGALDQSVDTYGESKDINIVNSQKYVRIPSMKLLSQKIEENHNAIDEDEFQVAANLADAASVSSLCSPSGNVGPASIINISSYLGADDINEVINDDNEQPRSAFRLSRYFSVESAATTTGTDFSSQEMDVSTEPTVDNVSGKTNIDVACVGVVDKHPSPRHAIEEDIVLTKPKCDSCGTISTDSEVSMYYSILPGEENNSIALDTSMNTAFFDDPGILLSDDSPQEAR